MPVYITYYESGEYQKERRGKREWEGEGERERERERERDLYQDPSLVVWPQLSKSDVFAKANISNKATPICLCQSSELVDAILYHCDQYYCARFEQYSLYLYFWMVGCYSKSYQSKWQG